MVCSGVACNIETAVLVVGLGIMMSMIWDEIIGPEEEMGTSGGNFGVSYV